MEYKLEPGFLSSVDIRERSTKLKIVLHAFSLLLQLVYVSDSHSVSSYEGVFSKIFFLVIRHLAENCDIQHVRHFEARGRLPWLRALVLSAVYVHYLRSGCARARTSANRARAIVLQARTKNYQRRSEQLIFSP